MKEKGIITDLKAWSNPSKESLWSKIEYLETTLDMLEKLHAGARGREDYLETVMARCRKNIENAHACTATLSRNVFGLFSLPVYRPHLAWQFLHRVDEDILLLVPDEELYARAADVKTYFDLNIADEKVRREWLGGEGGEKGRLVRAVEEIERPDEKSRHDSDRDRHILREALRIVNTHMDRNFWVLSMNTLTSVLSGLLLGGAMLLFWWTCQTTQLGRLGADPVRDYLPVAFLGLMGAYLSNLITMEGFLFVRGGPFWRYMLHHLCVKPILSSFTSVFVYLLAKSQLVFSINAVDAGQPVVKTATQAITLNVGREMVGYVYAVVAVVSGFAADKLLRDMIDRVLKRLEEKAEKTKPGKGA